MPTGVGLLILALAPVMAYVLTSRLRPAFALPMAVYLSLILAAPANLGESPGALSFAMFFNRIGWAALSLLFILFLPPRIGERVAADGICAAVLTLLMLYTKASFGLVALAFLACLLLNHARRPWAAIAVAATAAVTLALEAIWRLSSAYAVDLAQALHASGAVRGGIENVVGFDRRQCRRLDGVRDRRGGRRRCAARSGACCCSSVKNLVLVSVRVYRRPLRQHRRGRPPGGDPRPRHRGQHRIFANNVIGTYNVFSAAREAGIRNFVWASSETVLGLPFDAPPPYLPVDEDVPVSARDRVLAGKALEEEMARQFCRWDPQLKMIGLRFSNVMEPADYAEFPAWNADPSRKWNLWSYIDARDGAQAVRRALEHDPPGMDVFIIANADTVTSRPNVELVADVFPDVPVRRPSASTRRCSRSTRRGGSSATSPPTAGGTRTRLPTRPPRADRGATQGRLIVSLSPTFENWRVSSYSTRCSCPLSPTRARALSSQEPRRGRPLSSITSSRVEVSTFSSAYVPR